MANLETKTLDLSAFDQAIVRVYVRILYGFAFTNPAKIPEAVETIRQALLATQARYPFIGGALEPDGTDEKQNVLRCTFQEPMPAKSHPAMFVVKKLSLIGFPQTYHELTRQGAPPSAMTKELLSSLPEHPKPGETCPAFGLQVNFIKGGLILCFAFHHTIFDGVSSRMFLQAFTDRVRDNTRSDAVPIDFGAQRRLSWPTDCSQLRLDDFPEYTCAEVQLRVAPSRSSVSHILTFSSEGLAQLKAGVSAYLEATGVHPDVSTADCLSGLLWVAVMRARRERLSATDVTRYAIAVDVRHKLPLPEGYFGNAVLHTVATASVSELIGPQSAIDVASIGLAASRIRHAVNSVNTAYVHKRLNLFASLSDPTSAAVAFKRAIDMPNTGLDFSDWREQGADLEFQIPGAGSITPDWVRKTWSANEGAVNIMPRKGGKKGPADWEVLLALSVEDMERVCSSADGLGYWASRVVE
ncbi:hypothetical protein LTR36_010047 [Oleoguttula mirabilis]|uniref:Uncharacterized protein n=1 Tax=Oleoguttula mirabilis TaxID=1507867 RepID=A0AAV9JRD7_9PEZI|nr:hypothetical protein LTR36_010047 [Oleoguttula mirabilis]